jgi:trk system potassium uptake protein TrkA
MNIIILGAGQVGSSLAQTLVSENNNITIVDRLDTQLQRLQEHIDIRTVCGNASSPQVLLEAGIEDADLLIAVTSSDEINMVACHVAYALFHTPTKIARIRSADFLDYPELFGNTVFAIDVLISPELLLTEYITKLIEYPSALQVLDFANEQLKLVAVKALPNGPLTGKALSSLKEDMPDVQARVVAIFRQNVSLNLEPDTHIQPYDEIFFLATPQCIQAVMAEWRRLDAPGHSIIIAGGGNIGLGTAAALQHRFHVKIIEQNPDRLDLLSTQLEKVVVLEGHAADKKLLTAENIDQTDIFCAVTNNDEINILSAMLAKRLGCKKVLALVTQHSYVEVVDGGEIDIAISPQQATIGSLLQYVRKGDVVKVHALRRGAEAIEAIAHGDEFTSQVVGKRVKDIQFPSGTLIGAIVRKNQIVMDVEDCIIQAQDHVILFVSEKKHIRQVEKLFQVDIAFM